MRPANPLTSTCRLQSSLYPWLVLAIVCLHVHTAWASSNSVRQYQTPKAFVAEAFDGQPPKAKVLWLKGELRDTIADILSRPYPKLRIRYWLDKHRSVWVLDAIGKERPITAGLVVNQGRLERLRVLTFRESRGWEIRHEFFTDQFKDLGTNPDGKLDHPIDGITGATLSVRAMKRLARIALLLHKTVTHKTSSSPTKPATPQNAAQ